MGMDSSAGGNGLARIDSLLRVAGYTAIVSGLWEAIVVQLATGEPILALDRQGTDTGTTGPVR